MNAKPALSLYHKYYTDRDDERVGLFKLLVETYIIQRALYAGSFVHVAPSFVIPEVVYVDSDRQANKFFANMPEVLAFIATRKKYEADPLVSFHGVNYTKSFDEPEYSFDLLISQYAGFVSQHCKRYLKVGGLLLVNNSHGDASMAHLDQDYDLKGVVTYRSGRYRLVTDDLDAYFVRKKPGVEITREFIEHHQRGIGYVKTGSAYVFERVVKEKGSTYD